jgi:pyrroloquinoline quinone (PQQ) biosynthesis protein C
VRNFVEFTFEITARNRPHELASAFTFGREEVVPALFGELVADLDRDQPGNVSLLRYYLTRHNQVEVEQHGQAALRMVNKLAGDDPDNWTAVERVAQESLNMRIELWDYINETMPAE